MSLIILKPACAETGYAEAADIFARMYRQITGRTLPVAAQDDGISDLIVIGSDAVNDFVMNEVLELRLENLGIRYGTDDYCIRSHRSGMRRALILAGDHGLTVHSERRTLVEIHDLQGCALIDLGDGVRGHTKADGNLFLQQGIDRA